MNADGKVCGSIAMLDIWNHGDPYETTIYRNVRVPLPPMRLAAGLGKRRFPIVRISQGHAWTNTPQKIGSPTVAVSNIKRLCYVLTLS